MKNDTKQLVGSSIVILESGDILQMPTSGILNTGNQSPIKKHEKRVLSGGS